MKKRQKILHIVEAMGGGVFTYIVELANGLCDEYEVTIAFGLRNETPENYEEYFDESIKLIHIKNFTRSVNPVKDLKATVELRKIVKEYQPDIVHMHSSKAGAIGRIMLRRKNQKMFYTPHGYSFLMEDASTLKKKIYGMIEWMCGRANCLTVGCGKGEWEASHKVTKKSTYISNGVNMKKIDEIMKVPDMKGKTHPFTVYTLGRINYQKNPEMFNEIASRMPEVRFLWIGDGDMRECLTSKNISITGWAQSDQALEIAKNGDVFLLPSRWEGLPLALLEAMYMKKLCIVSNVAGNKDMVRDGVTGYICNTVDEFVETIKKVQEGNNDKIIRKAYQQIVGHYNSGWLCLKYRELYKE